MKPRKIITTVIAVVLLLSMCVVFSSCSRVKRFDAEREESPVDGLICISVHQNFIKEYTYDQYILYDPDTLVMYSMIVFGEGVSVTVLYNADGTLKLYSPNENK